MGSAFANLQTQVANAVANINLPSAFGNSLQPNPGNTTTAVNALIVVNGQVQGAIKTFTIDETFNYQRVRAIGSAIAIAQIPGVYEATGTFNRAFVFGQSIEQSFGGGIRAVTGRYQTDPDFTKFYFNIVELDNLGNILATRHDCVLASVRRTTEIDSVVIMDDATIMVRWSD